MDGQPFGSHFKLFRPDGLQVDFFVNGQDLGEFAKNYIDFFVLFEGSMGYRLRPDDLEPGEEVEGVGGWAMGEGSDGKGGTQQVVYLYSNKPGLQFRVANVYPEKFSDLPFSIPAQVKVYGGEGAPTRQGAIDKGVYYEVHEFDVVMKPTGKLDSAGRPMTKFDRVRGAAKAPEAEAPKDNGIGHKVWDSSADAVAWAVNRHAYPNIEDGTRAYTELWHDLGNPKGEAGKLKTMAKWETHVDSIVAAIEAGQAALKKLEAGK